MTGNFWTRAGAVSGAVGVVAGSFGAHGLEAYLEDRYLAVFETAVRYQMYHALALVAVGLLEAIGRPSRALTVAAWGFLLGTVLFSGSLYALALTRVGVLGAITPFGGAGFILGWVALAAHRPRAEGQGQS